MFEVKRVRLIELPKIIIRILLHAFHLPILFFIGLMLPIAIILFLLPARNEYDTILYIMTSGFYVLTIGIVAIPASYVMITFNMKTRQYLIELWNGTRVEFVSRLILWVVGISMTYGSLYGTEAVVSDSDKSVVITMLGKTFNFVMDLITGFYLLWLSMKTVLWSIPTNNSNLRPLMQKGIQTNIPAIFGLTVFNITMAVMNRADVMMVSYIVGVIYLSEVYLSSNLPKRQPKTQMKFAEQL